MKKLITIIGLLSIGLSAYSADVLRFGATVGNPSTVVSSGNGGWTNSIAATLINTNATPVFLPAQTTQGALAVQVKGIGANDVTTNFTIVTLQQSVNGQDWVALATVTNLVPSTVATVTIGAVPYVRVYSIKNSDAAALTNYSVTICSK